MLLRLDSFNHYPNADATAKWTQLTRGANPTTTVIGAYGRGSSNGLRLTSSGSSGGNQSYALNLTVAPPLCARAPSGATVICGMAWKSIQPFTSFDVGTSETVDQASIFAVRYAGTTHVWFKINQNGTISAYRGTTLLGTSTTALTQNSWAYLEFKVTLSTSAGVVQLRVNNTLDATLDLSSQNTRGGSADLWDEVRLGPYGCTASGASGTPDVYHGDFYLADGSGADGWTGFMGDMNVFARLMTANGTNRDGTPSTGSDQYAVVDEASANGDADYNTLAAVSDIDTFVAQDAPVVGATVLGVQVVCQARKTDSGSAGHKAVLRIGGTDYLGTEVGLGSSYLHVCQPWGISPATSAQFTEPEFNGTEPGYTKTA